MWLVLWQEALARVILPPRRPQERLTPKNRQQWLPALGALSSHHLCCAKSTQKPAYRRRSNIAEDIQSFTLERAANFFDWRVIFAASWPGFANDPVMTP
jgi:hypothetical protein